MEIKVMTFNLRCIATCDGINIFDNRKDKIKDVVKKENPELIGFQEVTDIMKKWIVDNVDGYIFEGCGRDKNYHGESTLIAIKKDLFEVIKVENLWLSNTPEIPGSTFGLDQSVCPRLFTSTYIKHDGIERNILYINAHFDHIGAMARLKSSKAIHKYIKSNAKNGDIIILTGDFNALPDSKEITFFKKSNSLVHDCTDNIGGTFHDYGRAVPFEKIDYVFSNAECKESYIVPDEHKDGIYYSDHFAVCAKLDV